MSDFGDPKLAAFLTFLDLALEQDKTDPRRQYAFLDHVRECVESRLVTARAAVAAEVRRRTPPPRRPSGAFQAQHSRAETERHNTGKLVEQAEAERELGERPTPTAFDPPAIRNQHPDRER